MPVINGSVETPVKGPMKGSVKTSAKGQVKGAARGSGSRAVHTITGAPASLKDDVMSREKRYLLSMGIRTACFIGALIASGPLRWVLLAGAVFLPYVAVVLANVGRSPSKRTMTPYVPQAKQLTEKTSGHD